MRLLVVEDEAGLREQLQAALMAEGFVVEAAGDGKEARWLGESEPFDAIVLGAVPTEIRPFVDSSRLGEEGIEVELSNGLRLIFGDDSKSSSKW